MEDYKVNLVEGETPSTAEKEETVLQNAGVNTDSGNTTYKVDLSKPPEKQEDAIPEQSTDEIPVRNESESSEKVEEEVRSTEEPSEEEKEEVVLELVEEDTTETQVENITETKVEEAPAQEAVDNKIELPENIQKVVEFMEETGGSLEDYVRLNADYSTVDEDTLLKEYYKQSKSHLDNDEIDFLIEDNFSYDEEIDDDRDIRRTKLAYKEELVKAYSLNNFHFFGEEWKRKMVNKKYKKN